MKLRSRGTTLCFFDGFPQTTERFEQVNCVRVWLPLLDDLVAIAGVIFGHGRLMAS